MADSEIEQTDQMKKLKVTNKEIMSILHSIQHQHEQNKKSSNMQSE